MKLNSEQVATLARCECQFVRTNSGDSVYLFTHEGLLRFAANVVQPYTFVINPQECYGPQGLGELEVAANSNWRRIQELEDANLKKFNQISELCHERDAANRRTVDAIAAGNEAVKVAEHAKVELLEVKEQLRKEAERAFSLSRKVEEYEQWAEKMSVEVRKLVDSVKRTS